jgi:microcystin-dependent protein
VALFRDTMGGTAAQRVTSASTGGANAGAMAARGGAQTETLTVNHLPSHDHGGTTGTGGAHTHTYDKLQDGSYPGYVLDETGYAHPLPASIASSGSHNHTMSAQGGGQGHSTMPPWFSLGLIIKT